MKLFLSLTILFFVTSAKAEINKTTWTDILDMVFEIGEDDQDGESISMSYTEIDGEEDKDHITYKFIIQKVPTPMGPQARIIQVIDERKLNKNGNWEQDIWLLIGSKDGSIAEIHSFPDAYEHHYKELKDGKVVKQQKMQITNEQVNEKWQQAYKQWVKTLKQYKIENDINTL